MLRAPTIKRHEIDAEPLHHRHGKQEHHRRAVRGEDLVVEIRTENGVVRSRQLQAHQRRQHAADQEEREGGDQIAAADGLVVDVREPAVEPCRVGPGLFQLVEVPRRPDRSCRVRHHRSVSRYATSAWRSSAARGFGGI